MLKTAYHPACFELPVPPLASGRPLPGSPDWERPDWPSSASRAPRPAAPRPGVAMLKTAYQPACFELPVPPFASGGPALGYAFGGSLILGSRHA
jgi:hypothetical protein